MGYHTSNASTVKAAANPVGEVARRENREQFLELPLDIFYGFMVEDTFRIEHVP